MQALEQEAQLEKNGGDLTDEVGDGSVTLWGHPVSKRKSGKWRAATFLHALLFADSFSIFGIGGNLFPYAFGVLHLSIAKSSNVTSNFVGTIYLLPIFFGYLADTYFGRFWVIAASALLSFTVILFLLNPLLFHTCAYGFLYEGLIILTLSVTLPSLTPASCTPSAANPVCPQASDHVLSWWFGGLYLLAIGSGGIKPCFTSLGQDQFDYTDPMEKKTGIRWFSSYYTNLNVCSAIAYSFLLYAQIKIGFGWGYGIILALYCAGVIIFFIGTPFYRHQKPGGSQLTRIAQVIFVTLKNLRKPLPKDPNELYEVHEVDFNKRAIERVVHTTKLRLFDRAAIVTDDTPRTEYKDSGWRVCTVTQVEEFKALIQILPIWTCSVSIYTIFSQCTGVAVQQSASLDRKLGHHFTIPAASSLLFVLLTAIMFIPIWEYLLVPLLRKFTGHPRGLSPLRQIGVALFLSIFAMLASVLVEAKRVKEIRDNHLDLILITNGLVPMSVFYLVPQFGILGVTEFLLGSALFKFFYDETPASMKSMATSLTFACTSVGYFCSTALVNAVNRYTKSSGGWLAAAFYSGGLKKYYILLTIVAAINFVIFTFFAYWYTYKEYDTDQITKTFPDEEERKET